LYHGERFNSISHLIGAALSLIGASVLITMAAYTGDAWKIASTIVYGFLTVFLFSFSTLYHSISGPSKAILRKLDHIAIYLMIAGTYTPFTLVSMRERHGWWIFAAVWSFAIAGTAYEVFRRALSRKISYFIYGLMILFIAFFLRDLWLSIPQAAMFWLMSGCALFGIGACFYAYDKQTSHRDDRWTHAHGVWHIFVIFGAFCQYLSVTLSILG
jgi:hemolysin III